MWPFGRRGGFKEHFEDHLRIKVGGWPFVIRKVNPLLDFPSDRMPRVFTDFLSRRKGAQEKPPQDDAEAMRRAMDDMAMMFKAGIVSPKVTDETEGGDSVPLKAIFYDMDAATQLYGSIIEHSLGRLKGLRGLFFSTRAKCLRYTLLLRGMANRQ